MNDLSKIALTMSTLEIAGLAAKRHDHVIRDMVKIVKDIYGIDLRHSPNLGNEEIQGVAVHRDYRGFIEVINLDRSHTLTLLTGWDAKARKRVVDRWVELEAAIAPPHSGEIDAGSRQTIGDLVEAAVHKEVVGIVPALVAAEIASNQFSIGHGFTAGEVLSMSGVNGAKATKGLAGWVSRRLDAFHKAKGVPVRLGRLGLRTALLFDPATCKEWLASGGRTEIDRRIAERHGQGALQLVGGKG